jgi:hypothetical protein
MKNEKCEGEFELDEVLLSSRGYSSDGKPAFYCNQSYQKLLQLQYLLYTYVYHFTSVIRLNLFFIKMNFLLYIIEG